MLFLDNADKGKKFVQENMIVDNMRNDDWMDSSPSVPCFDIIFDGSKFLEELRDVQVDQLPMKQFLDHPRVLEQLEVLINSNEVSDHHSIEPNKILSDPVVSNQFHGPDAIISNPLGNPSPVCADLDLVIGESFKNTVGEVVGFKHLGVV
ncbi:unnamed protein product [Lactuca saligna]|uniref:Uncharacterized protein n=1 Tax=Lactuca saligna TaxID=75948 RepID=A0AA35ZHF9_LACSI|nr:unnamed protein product [Lactuca saligna]